VRTDTKLGYLLKKMRDRNEKLTEQQETVQEAMSDPTNLKTQIQSLSGIRDLRSYNADKDTAFSSTSGTKGDQFRMQ
jgi:hypothetical protein